MNKKEFEKKFHKFNAWTYDHPSQHYSRDDIWQWIKEQTKELQKDRDIYREIAIDAIGKEKVENIRQFILGLKKLKESK